jgi:phosphoribosylglycinamide formyltransferase 1
MKPLPRIAIFASGNGSNAQRIAEHFDGKNILKVTAIYCNNPNAFVLERALNLGIPSVLFDRDSFLNTVNILHDLNKRHVDWVILAGFLWLIPDYLIKEYKNRIINIHPALLPKYGGKGMYGSRVHESVIANGESESGITIHYVNEKYDDGQVIYQAKCKLSASETPKSLAAKVHALEYKYFPVIIEKLVKGEIIQQEEN